MPANPPDVGPPPATPPTVRDVAKVVPACPACGCDRYHSLTENSASGFRLKSLRCETCQHDILRAFEQTQASKPDASQAMMWSVVLCFVIVSELVLIVSQVWH